MRVTAETKRATEGQIRAAARKLFLGKGFDATSTRELAAAADIAVGTLFNYFPSKEALAVALLREALDAGRALGTRRVEGCRMSLGEELFALAASDIRALEPLRAIVGVVIEGGLSPFSIDGGDAAAIRAQRLEDVGAALRRHGRSAAATAPVMHLYWSVYLGALSFWAGDRSPNRENTWALLDQSVQMFVGALPADSTTPTDGNGPASTSGSS